MNGITDAGFVLELLADHPGDSKTAHTAHHGFNEKLLARMKPSFCPVAADAIKNWQHPAARVTRAVASAGALLLVTNANETTGVREIALNHAPKSSDS